jgi:hypothetical protein
LNWDEISEVFQRTPNPGLKFWYRVIDCRCRHQRNLKLFGIPSVIITPLGVDKSLPLSKLHLQSHRIFPEVDLKCSPSGTSGFLYTVPIFLTISQYANTHIFMHTCAKIHSGYIQ